MRFIKMEIKFKNLKEVQRLFDKFGQEIYSLGAMNEIKPKFKKEFNDTNKALFNSEGATGRHGKWKSLSPKYRAWKEKRYPGKGIMVRKGNLKKALTANSGDSAYIASKYGNKLIFTWFVTLKYWIYHQKGAGRLPMRKTFDPKNRMLKRFLLIVYAAVLRRVRRLKLFDRISIEFPTWDVIDLP